LRAHKAAVNESDVSAGDNNRGIDVVSSVDKLDVLDNKIHRTAGKTVLWSTKLNFAVANNSDGVGEMDVAFVGAGWNDEGGAVGKIFDLG